jgi:hypothetical protein
MSASRRNPQPPPKVLPILDVLFLQAEKDSLGLPTQMDSLYLAGCTLTDFQCISLGVGRKVVNIQGNLSADIRVIKHPGCIRDLGKRNRAKH